MSKETRLPHRAFVFGIQLFELRPHLTPKHEPLSTFSRLIGHRLSLKLAFRHSPLVTSICPLRPLISLLFHFPVLETHPR